MSAIHHVAITVSDFDKSIEFYEKLGFKELFRQSTPQKRKKLALLGLNDLKLEVFYYEDFKDIPKTRETIGNNVHAVGMKHFALNVGSLQEARTLLEKKGIKLASEPDIGDAGYDFFFIKDPDGIWIEYVQDGK